MAVKYHQILRALGLRTLSLAGNDEIDLETTYRLTVLTEEDFKEGADFTFTAHKDALINGEELIATAIASSVDKQGKPNHPLRALLHSTTLGITPGSAVTGLSSGGLKVLGEYGSVRDRFSGIACTERPIEVIRRINAETWRTYPLYHFCWEGPRLYHTRSECKADCCVYDRATQSAALDANGDILFPDALEPAYIDAALSFLTRDNAFAEQAAFAATRLVKEFAVMGLAA